MSNQRKNPRRQTETVIIGTHPNEINMGCQHPIVIQSMTNTPTADVDLTVKQIQELVDAGSELVRITVNDAEAMAAIPRIRARLNKAGYTVPLIGDFHYNGHVLLTNYPESAQVLDKYRINPGNVGKGANHDPHFKTIIQAAIRYNKPVRIGVNWGSLDPAITATLMDENKASGSLKSANEIMMDAMLLSAKRSAQFALDLGLPKNKMVLSVKMSQLSDMVTVYQRLASETDYVLHLGLTEAGSQTKGLVSSAAALAIVLQQGIGDTIRMSLTPTPNTHRIDEVIGCKTLLQAMGYRHFQPTITSCPGCGRTKSDAFVVLAQEIQAHIDDHLSIWKQQYPGVETLHIAVMGCVVNGPGESKQADIGISLPGLSETPRAPVYIDGQQYCMLKGARIKEEFVTILDHYIEQRFG